ncbi:MAG: hypothetical protein RMM53_06150 [Bacteroidia bacterium]|nr:hypothetical protein [Bacteroidia bacterium]MDW8333777.1 hypothetical protein [Bacteroidia bacterium]
MTRQATGTVVYNHIEGGFWGLETDEGQKLLPRYGLPEEFCIPGIKVAFEYRESSVFSAMMWGDVIELVSIRKA